MSQWLSSEPYLWSHFNPLLKREFTSFVPEAQPWGGARPEFL